jgi:hypothetical protein
MKLRILVMSLVILLAYNNVTGQEATEQSSEKAQGGDDLRSAVQNPISSLISLPFKFTFDYGAPNGEASFLNIQPVVPVTVGNWNLVNRAIVPLVDSPGEVNVPGNPNPVPGDGATGLGDINYSLFFFPEMVPPDWATSITRFFSHRLNTTRSSGASALRLRCPRLPATSSVVKNGPPDQRRWPSPSPNGDRWASSAGICGHLPVTPIARM